MSTLLKDFKHRRRIALEAGFSEVTMRLVGLLDWMETIPIIARRLKALDVETEDYWKSESVKYPYGRSQPPQPRDVDEIARVGLEALRMARNKERHLYDVASHLSISGKATNYRYDESLSDAIISRYVIPFLDTIEQGLPPSEEKLRTSNGLVAPPAIIHDSLKRFRSAHRNADATCFIMMRFGKTRVHSKIETAIKKALKKHGLTGLLARDREFHEDLFPNIWTYVYGCAFGIAVFERLVTDEFNPNVALEVGYMLGLRKQVLLLKDQTLKALHTDLVGKLYREFDPQKPDKSIPGEIDSWLSDKGLA